MILLEVQVLAKGGDVGEKIGNPQPFKPGQSGGAAPQVNGASHPPAANSAPAPTSNAPVRRPPPQNPYNKGIHDFHVVLVLIVRFIEVQDPSQQFFSHVRTEPPILGINQYSGEFMCLAR